jgi:cytochrome P450
MRVVSYMECPKNGKADDIQIINNATILISTGTGTTAPLMCAAVYYILSRPDVHSKLCHEIRSAAANVSEMSMDLVNDMAYLKSVMAEAIRLYPPVAGTLTRVIPKGGVEICGQFVPENTVVGVHHFATYHSARNFKYPDEFRPERWDEDVSEEFEGDHREALQPFSVGPRKCIAYE